MVTALLCVAPFAFSMEHTSLRQSRTSGLTKVGLFVEGFSPESVFRTKMTIKSGMEGVELVELTLNDLKGMAGTDIQLFVAPSETAVGSEAIVKEGMGILAGFVSKGHLLFSQVDSSSVLCKEFDYNGQKTTNSPFIFDGVCVGPITKIGPMEKECRAASVLVDSRTRMITYNNLFVHGGFYFVDPEKSNCKPLGSMTPRDNSQTLIEFRKNTDAKAVIVVCKHGSGAAILSGIQLDQNVAFLDLHLKRNPDHSHIQNVKEHLSDISEFSNSLLHFMAMLKVIASSE